MKEKTKIARDGNGWRFIVIEIDEAQPKMRIEDNGYVFNSTMTINKPLSVKQLKDFK